MLFRSMCLTEPQCGTDLGLIRTKAVPNGALGPDGETAFKITGTKIFISAGDHDLTENIVHLVLARIEGAPVGTKGISMFVVPKILPGPDGTPGAPNGVTCGGIEEKMGIHANATCVMNFDGATGWLVGEENKGLRAMFTMMNEARLGVAIQGLSQSEAAYQNAASYAKERLQGRALTGPKAPGKPADPINDFLNMTSSPLISWFLTRKNRFQPCSQPALTGRITSRHSPVLREY